MLIRNVKSKYDLEQKKKQLSDYLGLQIQNEEIRAKRQADYKNPNKPPPVPPQFKSANEIQVDSLEQQKELIDNLKNIGIAQLVANQFSQNLLQETGGIANLTKFNKLFPQLKKQITDKINPAYANTDDLMSLWREFDDEVENTLKYSGPNPTNIFGTNSPSARQNTLSTTIATYEDYQDLDSIFAILHTTPNFGPIFDGIVPIYLLTNFMVYVQSNDFYKNIFLFPTLLENKFNKMMKNLITKYHFPTKAQLDDQKAKLKYEIQNNNPNSWIFPLKAIVNLLSIVTQKGFDYLNEINTELVKEVAKIDRTNTIQNYNNIQSQAVNPPPNPPNQSNQPQNYLLTNYNQPTSSTSTLTTSSRPMLEHMLEDRNIIVTQQQQLERNANIQNQNHMQLVNRPRRTGSTTVSGRDNMIVRKQNQVYTPIEENTSRNEARIVEKVKPGRRKSITVSGKDNIKSNAPPEYGALPEKRTKGRPKLKSNEGRARSITVIKPNENVVKKFVSKKAKELLKELKLVKKLNKNNSVIPNLNNIIEEKIDEYEGIIVSGKQINDSNILNSYKIKIDDEKKEIGELKDKIIKLRKPYTLKSQFNKPNSGIDKELIKKVEKQKEITGVGLKDNKYSFVKARIKIGKGLTVNEDEPRFQTFGKYILHIPFLKEKNILNFRYPSTGMIPSIKPVEINDNYKEFILDLLDTGKINNRHYETLSQPEKDHFIKVARGAKLLDSLKIKNNLEDNETKDLRRLELLYGEYKAGNDNEKMIKEAKGLIKKYIANGGLNKNKGLEMLLDYQ